MTLTELRGITDAGAAADQIIAFFGSDMYILKNRTGPTTSEYPPGRAPDIILGYYSSPTPHIIILPITEKLRSL